MIKRLIRDNARNIRILESFLSIRPNSIDLSYIWYYDKKKKYPIKYIPPLYTPYFLVCYFIRSYLKILAYWLNPFNILYETMKVFMMILIFIFVFCQEDIRDKCYVPGLLASIGSISLDDTRDYYLGNNNKQVINPWYITGFTDGEGCFSISTASGKVKFQFKITQLARNAGVLYDIQRYFGVGSVVVDNRESGTLKYQVQNQKELLEVIIPHFERYPLLSSKRLNYLSFKKALEAKFGFISIKGSVVEYVTDIKNKMNKSRSFTEKYYSVELINLNPYWVQGFVDGEGLFYVYVNGQKKSRNTTYVGIDLSLEISQSSHDVKLLHSFVQFFEGGFVSPKCNFNSLSEVSSIRGKSIFKYKTNLSKMILFFDKYPLLTDKGEDFKIFKEI